MIRLKHWCRAPALPLVDALKNLNWYKVGDMSPASGTAALMLYVAILFTADEELSETGEERWVSLASYDGLIKATGGMSRSLVNQGLQRLQELGLILPEGSRQKRQYLVLGLNKARDWYKLPCQSIVQTGVIGPFRHFTLRSKHELHALKLYLYLASVRSRENQFTEVSYERIYERIGIPERDIRRAIAVLINCGLLVNVVRNVDEETHYGPNRYYLMGSQKLFSPVTEAASQSMPSTAATAPVF